MYLGLMYSGNGPFYSHIIPDNTVVGECHLRRAFKYYFDGGNGAFILPEHGVNDLSAQIQELLHLIYNSSGRENERLTRGCLTFVSAFTVPPSPTPILSSSLCYKVALYDQYFYLARFCASPSVRPFSLTSSL